VPRGARTDTRADTAIAVLCAVLALVLLILPAAPRDAVARVVRGNLVGPLVALQARASLARRSFIANDSIALASDSMLVRSIRLDATEAENARLRALLGLGRALRWGFIPAEALVGRGMGDEFTFVLSAGRRDGVERFSAVVGAEGLIGVVTQVDERTSIAMSWPHPSFSVSATTADAGAFGIVTAHQGSGAERYLLEMRGVQFRAQVRPGTRIMSSGLGGVFPRGVLIGTVLEELPGSTGWSKSYLVRPAVRPAEVSQVLILLPERNAEGVEGTWVPSRDSVAADSTPRVAVPRPVAPRDTTPGDTTPGDTTPRGGAR
jgi:rod shape-determining protein MreC